MTKEQEVWLKENKGDSWKFLTFPVQSFDFCVEAIKSAKDEDRLDFLKCIDPEFRTYELLKAISVEPDEFVAYEDEEFEYSIQSGSATKAENWTPGNNEGGMYYLYGQCNAAHLEIAQKILRRSLECRKELWEYVWKGNPMDADCYYENVYPDKNYFKMVFGFDSETSMSKFHEDIFDAWWDTEFAEQYKLKLFYYNDVYTANDFGCTYYVQWWDEDKGDADEESESYSFEVGDFDDVNEVQYSRVAAIEKYIEYNLLKGSGNKAAINKAKEEWGKEVKNAEKTEEDERNSDDEDLDDWDDED